MIAVLEIIRCAAAVALLVVLAMYVAYRWYVSVKENAYEEAEESIKRAVREAGREIPYAAVVRRPGLTIR
jgi:hypothetical protein